MIRLTYRYARLTREKADGAADHAIPRSGIDGNFERGAELAADGTHARVLSTLIRWCRMYCVISALVSGLSLSASANTVTGRVVGAGGKFPPKGCFTVDGKRVCTDAQKTFSVYLAPGLHTAEFIDSDKAKWSGVIPAAPQPINKDLNLRK